MGGSFARFDIGLYYCGGGCERIENCGEMVATLCEVRHSNAVPSENYGVDGWLAGIPCRTTSIKFEVSLCRNTTQLTINYPC